MVSYGDYNIVSLKDSLSLGIGDDETPHVWQIACNHFILGTSPYGVWQGADGFERDMTFRLGYFPPDAKNFVTAETTTVGRRTLTLGRSSSDCFAIVQDLNSNNYTLYYELERLMEDQSELPNVGFFGTCYVNFDTKEVKDAQSGEQWSLNDVLPTTTPQDVRAYSSGKTGVLLRFGQDDNEWYFVSKNPCSSATATANPCICLTIPMLCIGVSVL